ncbi:MAG: sigma-70 family RNA polymerase sigma factor [Candidatus Zixiibacteriota bacterium]|jgi:RNA polymerase sigma factor (sigma-70 family)
MALPEYTDEQDLIARCRVGDQEAWRTLVERYQNVVYAIARRVVGPAHCDDAAQEAFVRVYRKLHTYRGNGSNGKRPVKFSSWLYRVAYNAAVDLGRKRGRGVPLADGFDAEYDGPGPDDVAAGAELATVAREALADLREDYRNVLELYYIMGKSYDQVAEITGMPLGTVKSNIHRGKKAMLNALREMGVADSLAGGM